MAYLSPPVVYVDPYRRRRGYYGGYSPYGNNAESAEYDSGDDNDPQEYNEQPQATESQVNQEYIAARDAHPLAKQHSEFTKVHCDSCGGFTMLKDGEVDELQHKDFCKEGKKLEVEATNCHNKKKTHVVTKHKTMPPPEEKEEEEEEEEESESDSDEEEEKEGDVIEIYLEDADKIAQSIEKSYNENKPFRGSFNKKIDAADGSGVMDVKVTLSTSEKNSKGVAALQFVLTPMENGKALKDSSISATLWHLNLNSKKSENRIAFQKDQAKLFKDANVQHEVLLATTSHVDAALSKIMKK